MKRIIISLIVLMGYANFIAQAQNNKYQLSSGIWFEVRTDSLNPCRYTEDNKIYQAERERAASGKPILQLITTTPTAL